MVKYASHFTRHLLYRSGNDFFLRKLVYFPRNLLFFFLKKGDCKNVLSEQKSEVYNNPIQYVIFDWVLAQISEYKIHFRDKQEYLSIDYKSDEIRI